MKPRFPQSWLRAPQGRSEAAAHASSPDIAAALATLEAKPAAKSGEGEKGSTNPSQASEKGGTEEKKGEDPPGDKPKSLKELFQQTLGKEDKGKKEDPAKKDDKPESRIDPRFRKTDGDDPGNVSSAVSKRFDAYKATESANAKTITDLETEKTRLLAEVETLKKGSGSQGNGSPVALEEQEGYKTLKAQHDALVERLERVSLMESPRFKAQYTDKLASQFGDLEPFVLTLADEAQQKDLASDLGILVMGTPAGKKQDAKFLLQVEAVLDKYEDLKPSIRKGIESGLFEMRKIVNEKGLAEENWKETQKGFKDSFDKESSEVAKAAVASFKQYNTDFEAHADNQKLVDGFRKTMVKDAEGKEVPLFKYDEIVTKGMTEAETAIQASIKAGAPTPELLKIVHEGVQGRFSAHRINIMVPVVASLMKDNATLTERLAKLEGSNPSKGASSSSSGKPADDDGKKLKSNQFGMVAKFKEMQKEA